MAYRTSRLPFEECKTLIEDLYEQKETMVFYTDNPRRLSYRLRESLYSCQFHEDLLKYFPLLKLYSFETHMYQTMTKESGYVRARFRGSDDVTKREVRPGDRKQTRRTEKPKDYPKQEPSEPPEALEMDDATDEMQRAVSTSILHNVSNLAGVIDGTKRYGSRVMEVYFPDTRLSDDDLTRLYRWTSENGWTIIDMEDGGLTLSKREVPEEVQWRPSA